MYDNPRNKKGTRQFAIRPMIKEKMMAVRTKLSKGAGSERYCTS